MGIECEIINYTAKKVVGLIGIGKVNIDRVGVDRVGVDRVGDLVLFVGDR